MISVLKLKVEEGKRIEDCLNVKLNAKTTKCLKLKEEIVTLRYELGKKKEQIIKGENYVLTASNQMKSLKQRRRKLALKILRRMVVKMQRLFKMVRKKVDLILTRNNKDLEVLHLQDNMLLLDSVNLFKVTIFLGINLGIRILIVQLDKEF